MSQDPGGSDKLLPDWLRPAWDIRLHEPPSVYLPFFSQSTIPFGWRTLGRNLATLRAEGRHETASRKMRLQPTTLCRNYFYSAQLQLPARNSSESMHVGNVLKTHQQGFDTRVRLVPDELHTSTSHIEALVCPRSGARFCRLLCIFLANSARPHRLCGRA